MYLTEKFIRQHPPGTRVRHPLYGAARIVESIPEGLIVEWESPLARMEQSNRIPAAEVPYMGRIVEVRTPMQAQTRFQKNQYASDHEDGLAVQQAVSEIEKIIDAVIDEARGPNPTGASVRTQKSAEGTIMTVTVPYTMSSDNGAFLLTIHGNPVRIEGIHLNPVKAAITQYYGQHGWSVGFNDTSITLMHPISESVNNRHPVNRNVLNFKNPISG